MPEDIAATLTEALGNSAKEQTENVVLEFGTDRVIKSLTMYGSVFMLAISGLLFFNAPISCLDQPSFLNLDYSVSSREARSTHDTINDSRNSASRSYIGNIRQSTTAMKQHMDYHCWATLEDFNYDIEPLISDTWSQEEQDKLRSSLYDPRNLMGDLIFFLIIQVVFLSAPAHVWLAAVGGTVRGQISYAQKLLTQIRELAEKIEKVQPQKANLHALNRDVYDKYSETIKPWLFSTSYPDIEEDYIDGVCSDKKFLNLLYSENVAHLPEVPYLQSLYMLLYLEDVAENKKEYETTKLNISGSQDSTSKTDLGVEKTPLTKKNKAANASKAQTAEDKKRERKFRLRFIKGQTENLSNLKNKVPTLQAILKLWTHKDNLSENYLAQFYTYKHLMQILIGILFLVLDFYYFDGFKLLATGKDLKVNEFTCEIPKVNLQATCIIDGYTDYFILFVSNMCLIIISSILMPMVSIYNLRFLKMKHHSAYFLNFLANSNLIFSQIQVEEDVDAEKIDKKYIVDPAALEESD